MLRRFISFVVLLGVMLHAHALVRHNSVMLDAHLLRTTLIADLLSICHPSGTGTVDAASLPDVPRPTDAQNDCPLCSGLGSAVALPAPDLLPYHVAFQPARLSPLPVIRGTELLRSFIPPARGPPRTA
ncbi:MAG: DUF2946 family protein [Hyphomicrobiaceae bacterium]